jgi:hypothetical protein
MEDYLKTNISYVYAIYPDNNIEDVTSNYTKVSNLTILVINNNQEPIKDVEVKLYSNNKKTNKYTNLSIVSNCNGLCRFTIGQGSYNIEGNSNNTTGKLSKIILIDGEDRKENLILNAPLNNPNYNTNEIIYINAIIITAIMVLLSFFILMLIKVYDIEKIKYFYILMILTIAFLLIIDIAIEPLVILVIMIVICIIGYVKFMKSVLNCSI